LWMVPPIFSSSARIGSSPARATAGAMIFK
jgi:hypothetical protein